MQNVHCYFQYNLSSSVTVFGQKTDTTYTNISQKMLVLLSIYKISTLAKHQHLEL